MSYIDAISSGREETTHTLQTTAPFKATRIIEYPSTFHVCIFRMI